MVNTNSKSKILIVDDEPLDPHSLNELIEKSDNSLYRAKRDGKNRVYSYSKYKNCILKKH